jgi:hypothetical protein
VIRLDENLLGKIGRKITRTDTGWSLTMEGRPSLTMDIASADHGAEGSPRTRTRSFLTVTASSRSTRLVGHRLAVDDAPWELLRQNAELPGNLRFGVDASATQLGFYADLAGDEGVMEGLESVRDGLKDGVRWLKAKASAEIQRGADITTDITTDIPFADLGPTLEESGWTGTPRDGGQFAVPLGDAPAHLIGILSPTPAGGAEVWVDLLPNDSVTAPVCRRALGIFLLGVCGRLRLARAVVRPSRDQANPEQETVGLQARIQGPPTATALADALAAVSVGARLAGHEVRELAETDSAHLFLKLREAPVFSPSKVGQETT